MKSIRHIALFLFAAAACWGCGEEEKIDIPAQRAAFETFLAGVAANTGLTADAELANGQNIYRLIPGPGSSSRRVEAGNRVTIEYYGCLFDKSKNKNGEWGIGGLFATNNPEVADSLGLTDYPGRVLPPRELALRQGAGEILNGIDRGLIRAGLRDTILLYLTSDLTYGNQATGFIPAGTPTVFQVIIHDINE